MTNPNEPVQAPRPFMIVTGENFDCAPISLPGPDGQPVGGAMLTIRNPVAAASMAVTLEFVDELVASLQKLRGSYTGPGLVVPPPGFKP